MTALGGSGHRPACDNVLRSERAEWREPESLTDGLAAFYRHCSDCWSEQPEPGTLVLRSTSNRASVYHRPVLGEAGGSPDHRLAADGGVLSYECDECGEISECDVDESGQRRCPDCGRAVTAVVTDGSGVQDFSPADGIERHLHEILNKSGSLPARYHARSALQYVAVLEQEADQS